MTNKTNHIDIAHLANLAKVEIDEATELKLQDDINSVVKMISKLYNQIASRLAIKTFTTHANAVSYTHLTLPTICSV